MQKTLTKNASILSMFGMQRQN